MKTKINWLGLDWRRVKNHCRTTDNKDFTDKDATQLFRRKLIISEHTPIRLLEIDWSWPDTPYWVSTEWSRHKFEKFISTQRDDRLIDDVPRAEKPQGALVKFDGYMNAQNAIDAWRKRMCFMATDDARGLAEDFKVVLRDDSPEIAEALVPNCIYRSGCPEFTTCGFWNRFADWADKHTGDRLWWMDIQKRYDLYNAYFYERHPRRG